VIIVKVQLAAFIIVAIMGLGVMSFSISENNITGQANFVKLPPEKLKKLVEQTDTSEQFVMPSPEKVKTIYGRVPTPMEPVEVKECDCNPYEGDILTSKEGGFLAGLTRIDCLLWYEILQIKKEIGKPYNGPDYMQSTCKLRNWWPD